MQNSVAQTFDRFHILESEHPLSSYYKAYVAAANLRGARISTVYITARKRVCIEYADKDAQYFLTHREALEYLYYTFFLKKGGLAPYQPNDTENKTIVQKQANTLEQYNASLLIDQLEPVKHASFNRHSINSNDPNNEENRKRLQAIQSALLQFS